jgi:SAM-dependent methyltransferase
MRLRDRSDTRSYGRLWDDFDEYDGYAKQFLGHSLAECRMLEIGFGARPLRLLALSSMGIDAHGVDLDMPVLDGSLREFLTVFKRNGFERCMKSIVRHVLFDRKEREGLARALRQQGFDLEVRREAFFVADAGSATAGAHWEKESFDLVFSEDVFEHIPLSSLSGLLQNMHLWLKPNGIALIRPNIFTGITGGHLLEWYAHTLQSVTKRQTEPWEHLRKKRQIADTFLNKLTRKQYREMFADNFEILHEKVKHPEIGREFIVEEIRHEIRLPDEELFSNQVMFVLRKKLGASHSKKMCKITVARGP